MKRAFSFLFFLIFNQIASAGDFTAARIDYINRFKEDAIRDMIKTGVPASITMAQACLESQNGMSKLASEANNHFGIKCSNWTGPSFIQDDDTKDECFRKYNSVLESYDDHSNFLRSRPRYSFLFEIPVTDYKAWARGLKKAGYATDPSYADRLIKIIEDHQLYLLDQGKQLQLDPIASRSPEVKPTVYASTTPNKRTEHRVYAPSVEIVDPFSSRKISDINGIDYVVARQGDTWKSLSKEFNYGYWQLPKYNETSGETPIAAGQIIYLKPKKKDNSDNTYTIKPGDDLYSVSQQTGVKMRFLLKYNNLKETDRLEAGKKILLNRKAKS